ncbi:hypothetical protein NDI39_02440 [Microcoleus sp. ZQ-A2]|nr:hypothetical protein [Microcoleus sp. FACHB-1]
MIHDAQQSSAVHLILLRQECDRINLYMDESEQLYPEQSTTAIIAHHLVAKYFSA